MNKQVERKIVQLKIVGDCSMDDIAKLKKELSQLELPDYDFIITNDKIELTDIKALIKQLFDLYKKYEEVQNVNKNN